MVAIATLSCATVITARCAFGLCSRVADHSQVVAHVIWDNGFDLMAYDEPRPRYCTGPRRRFVLIKISSALRQAPILQRTNAME